MSNTKPYLSRRMFEALVRMADGWELARMTPQGSTWIQKDGVGRGGDMTNVHGNTFDSLDRRRYVRRSSEKLGTICYRITDRGKKAVDDNRKFFEGVDNEKAKDSP